MTLSTSLPNQTSPIYAYDEDVLIDAGGDYAQLCPPWQLLAQGTDGVFASGTPWVLTSASVDFQSQGVAPNCVVQLTAPQSNFRGGGQFLAVDSVSGNSITLRRAYQDLNVGQPPAPSGGLTAVQFTIATFGPQLANASYDLKQRYAIDDNVGQDYSRATAWIYDRQVLRQATVFWVLYESYQREQRTDRGDFAIKAQRFRGKRDDALDRVQLRWGPFGNSAEPSTLFSCKISR